MKLIELIQRIFSRLAIAIGIIALLELLFRHGAWEPFVKPESNAGQSIRLKHAINALGADKIDFVTLGDSRAVYGIEHQRVADLAKISGFNHSNMSLAGMHWLSMHAVIDWTLARDKNLKGLLIATTITNFSYNGNGAYELGMAVPFLPKWDSERLAKSVPFNNKILATYGAYSALFQYREDIQNLIKEPRRRFKEKLQYSGQGAAPLTFSVKNEFNTCAVPMQTVAACASAKSGKDVDQQIIHQCKLELPISLNQADWRDWRKPGAVPHLTELAKLRQDQLRSLNVRKPILVILMPVPTLRRNELVAKGVEDFTKALMQPLVDDGTVALYDFTHFFDEVEGGECSAFFDLFHQNTIGQAKLTDVLLPIIKRELYERNTH